MATTFQTTGAFTEYGTTQLRTLGSIEEDKAGNRFCYVYNFGADTSVAGKLANWATPHVKGYVTMTAASSIAESLGTVGKPAGVWMAAVPTVNYGWIQISGYTTTLVTDGGVAEGDFLVNDGGATPSFIADTAVAGEEHGVFGLALADDSAGNVVTATIFCW